MGEHAHSWQCSPRDGEGPVLPKLTVWYNTRCPVCDAGIEWQRNRLVQAARSGAIEFRDINLEPEALAPFGASLAAVRRRLHGVDAAGRLFVGAECAAAIWARTPGDGWMARAAAVPGLRWVARVGYDRFADCLYAWNSWRGHW